MIPIDRLTDVRAPVEAIAARVGRRQLEGVYGLRLPQPARQEDPNRCGQAQLATQMAALHVPAAILYHVLPFATRHPKHDNPAPWIVAELPQLLPTCPPRPLRLLPSAATTCRPPTAVELLRAFAFARGWVASSGLPDETRSGRHLLKDYVGGKILYVKAPPGASQEVVDMAATVGDSRGAFAASAAAAAAASNAAILDEEEAEEQEAARGSGGEGVLSVGEQQEQQGAQEAASSSGGTQAAIDPAAAASAAAGASAGGAGPSASSGGAAPPGVGVIDLDEGDLLLMDDLDIGGKKAKTVRPSYKVRWARCCWR